MPEHTGSESEMGAWAKARVTSTRTIQDLMSALEFESKQQISWLAGETSTESYQRARRRVQIAASALTIDLEREQGVFAQAVGACEVCQVEPVSEGEVRCDFCIQDADLYEDEAYHALMLGGR